MPTKQAVLYKGIDVGKVTGVRWDRERRESVITFQIKKDFTLRRDAVIRIGYRSLLGDPYLAVDSRGSSGQPALKTGDEVRRTETTVDFDEALSFLDAKGRRHVKSLIRTVAAGTAAPGNGERLNATLGGASRTVSELHTLTRTLRGQEREIAELVRTASTVLTTIGDREQSIRTIVGSGRTTLQSLASNTRSLEQGLDELPRLLASGRTSLAQLRPLLTEARPVFAKLRDVSPPLARALDPRSDAPLGAAVGDLIAIAHGLGPLSRQATPVLSKLRVLLDELVPVVKAGGPGARNLVPALDYLTPRSKGIATGYALLASAITSSDSKGRYVRAALNLDPAELSDSPAAANCNPASQNASPNQGYCRNSYPAGDDALDPQPFRGPYSRISPCTVPSRKSPRTPCR